MRIKYVTKEQLEEALAKTNEQYDDNVIWNRFDKVGNIFHVTLRVKDSKEAGARRGFTGRRMTSACWHVHGDFFDHLIEINPDAVIHARSKTINKDGGNWVDGNIGSIMYPLYYSEACDC